MKVILENGTAEIVEKKSRFIADIFYVASIEEAEKKLNEVRKKYYDAKHHCYAYVIGVNGDIVKSSDDGEPSGTAGHPMLDILKGNNLTNVIAVVTRYFGGTLLGTGGLVRCYSESVKMALASVEYGELKDGFEVVFSLMYDEVGSFEKYIKEYDDKVVEIEKTYLDNVYYKYLVNVDVVETIINNIKNMTKGRIDLSDEKLSKKMYYTRKNECIYC